MKNNRFFFFCLLTIFTLFPLTASVATSDEAAKGFQSFALFQQSFMVIIVFGGLIFFHELGHFSVARLFNMGVKTFSIGFGPVLFSWMGKSTRYQVAAIPFGGYVALVGESADANIPAPFTKADSFSLRPAWQRFLVIFAGSFANLLLAWLIYWGLFFSYGKVEIPPVIGEVKEHSAAAIAGLQPGDHILSLNEKTITHWGQIPLFLQFNQGDPVRVVFERRDLGEMNLMVTPLQTTTEENAAAGWMFGIVAAQATHKELSFMAAAGEGLEKAKDSVVTTWLGLKGLVSQKIPASNVGGPIGIAQIIYDQAGHGFQSVLLLMALISVNLGFLNLLPIPVLDGGHLFFLTFEMISGKAASPAIQNKAMMVGLACLLFLMLFATVNDISRIFGF